MSSWWRHYVESLAEPVAASGSWRKRAGWPNISTPTGNGSHDRRIATGLGATEGVGPWSRHIAEKE